jgi:hypothetical protein
MTISALRAVMSVSALRAVAHRSGATLAAALALAGCVATAPTASESQPRSAATAAPASAFSAALRCMDAILLDHGVRDLSVSVEPLADPAQRQGAGTRELLMLALSDMTQRSRAIRVVSADAPKGTGQRDIHAVAPQYVLRGSIRQIEGAPLLRTAGADANAGATSVLGVDLALLNSQDMSLVPGTTSLNVLTARRSSSALQVELRKFNATFNPTWSGADAPASAMRSVVELASIELVGRLAKVPYWTCLGATDADEAVQAEIRDWYDTMAARPEEIIRYFQFQLRQRRAYDGAIDGTVNPAFKDAVARYREAMGQAREAKLSLEFFQAYLGADHRQVTAKLAPPAPAYAAAPAQVPSAPALVPAQATSAPVQGAPIQATALPARAPLNLRIGSINDARRFARGEAVQLTIRPNRDAHVYCFLQDEKRQVTRFFPNRWQRDSRVLPDTGLQLPGAMRFEIVMNPRGVQELVTCFATETDVLPSLPPNLNAADFHPLPVASIDQLRTAFARAAGGALAQDSFEIRAK